MAWAAEMMACRPEPHRRLTLKAGVSMGQPASMAATRERYASLVSVGITLPMTTWPTESGARPERWMAALTAVVASWVLGTSFRLPPKVPMAVRAVLTTKTSRWVMGKAPEERKRFSGPGRRRDAWHGRLLCPQAGRRCARSPRRRRPRRPAGWADRGRSWRA